MKSYRLPAFAAVALAIACGATDNPDVAARAGKQQLSVTRLADIIGNSQAPLEKDVARSIAELWVNYQLVGLAAARGDSLADAKVLDDALWSTIANVRVKKFYDEISKGWDTVSSGTDEARYNAGEALSARHILVKVDEGSTQEQRDAARRKAEAIRAEATPANFAKLAAKSDEPGAAERGGDLGLFDRNAMVPEFSKAVLATKPGEISPVIQTSFGYHIIYRPTFSEVATQFAPIAKNRNVVVAESTYLAKLEQAKKVELESNAAIKAKAIARNALGFTNDKSKLASYSGGELTSAEFADWIAAYPANQQIGPQLIAAPDTIVDKFIKQIVRNELVLHQADSAKVTLDSAQMTEMRTALKSNLLQTWNQLGVDPAQLADSAKSGGDKEKIVGAHIESFFDKLVKNESPFVDVSYPVARALHKKYEFAINEAGLDGAIERAKQVRATADSVKAQKPPTDMAPSVPVPPAGSGSVKPPAN